jgi:hypothetical protein
MPPYLDRSILSASRDAISVASFSSIARYNANVQRLKQAGVAFANAGMTAFSVRWNALLDGRGYGLDT